MSCPSAVELERAYWSEDAEVRAHAAECPRCGPEWAEIAALVAAGAQIATPPVTAERREEIRTALLTGKEPEAVTRPPRLVWQIASPLAAAAAVAAVWWLWPERARLDASTPAPPALATTATPTPPGRILAQPDAQYLRAGAPNDQIIRLVSGSVTLDAGALAAGERFRVITGDAEIEASGALLDASADGDRLVSVRVLRGNAVLSASGTPVVLSTGAVWRAPLHETRAPLHETPAAKLPEPRRGPARPQRRIESQPEPEPQPQPPEPQLPEPEPQPPATEPAAAPRTPGPAQRGFDAGWAAIRDGNFVAAAGAFERAASAGDPEVTEDARYWHAVALARAGAADAAMQAFERFLDAYPYSPHAGEASVMLGWLLYERGDHAHAERRFRAAVNHPVEAVWRSAVEGLKVVERK